MGTPKNKSPVTRMSRAAQTALGAQRITRLQAEEDICVIPTMGDEIPISRT